ncbi:MAG: RdgB/HAM1 family non-canonical purine NTP pyrophosphatase [Bacillota bacterium]|nr:RdgB/HAM1 family non-canonical purine NTP pyrophosphatase [Bacillota bacterium]
MYEYNTGKIRLSKNKTFVLASNNQHKISEIKHLTEHLGLEILSMREAGIVDDIVEDGSTFEENSFIKARHIYERYGFQSIADDSGLEVEALNGAPGVYSARYAGEEKSDGMNNALLIKNMADKENRNARFVSVITVIHQDEDGRVCRSVFRGEVSGIIIDTPRGTHGFGYDPLFEMNGKTMAELEESEKNKISHRARAMKRFLEALRD